MVNEDVVVITLAILQAAAIIIVLSIFIYQMKTRQRYTPHFTIALILSLIAIFFSILDLMEITTDPPLYLISGLMITLAFYSIYLHYEALSSIRPPLWRHTAVFGITIASVTIYLLKLAEILSEEISTNLIPLDAIESVLGVIVFTYATYVMINTHLLVKRLSTLIELVSLIILFLGNLCYSVGDSLWTLGEDWQGTYDLLVMIGDICVLAGILVFISNYLINIEYIYRIPVPIHEVIMLNSSGMPTYNRRVYAPKIGVPESFDKDLISGALTAISAIFKETLGRKARIKYLDLGDYQVFFSHIPNDQGSFVVLTSGGNFFLSKSLDRFIKVIPHEFIISLEEDIVNVEKYREVLDPLLLSAFRYLSIKK